MSQVALHSPTVAVTVALPSPMATIFPSLLTITTDESELLQTAVFESVVLVGL